MLGQKDISNLVIYASPARPPRGAASWWLSTRRRATRCGRRRFNHYAWSSPVAVYTPEGKSYIVLCDTIGNMFLLDGKTGNILRQHQSGHEHRSFTRRVRQHHRGRYARSEDLRGQDQLASATGACNRRLDQRRAWGEGRMPTRKIIEIDRDLCNGCGALHHGMRRGGAGA